MQAGALAAQAIDGVNVYCAGVGRHPEGSLVTAGGRVLEPVPYDARALGRDFALLRDPLPEFLLFGAGFGLPGMVAGGFLWKQGRWDLVIFDRGEYVEGEGEHVEIGKR